MIVNGVNIWAGIEDLLNQRERLVAARVDACACQTARDWDKFHEEENKYVEMEANLREVIGD